jgi:hypothetical protein
MILPLMEGDIENIPLIKNFYLHILVQQQRETELHKFLFVLRSCQFIYTLPTRINDRGVPLRRPRDTLYPQKLALTSLASGGRSVGIVRLRTKSHGVFFTYSHLLLLNCENSTRDTGLL